MNDNKYLIYVNGVLAKTRMTYAWALKDKYELEGKGYKKVTISLRDAS